MEHSVASVTLLLVALLLPVGCERQPDQLLQGQRNAGVTFYGSAIDESGAPIAGASIDLVVDAVPADWSFETRGNPHDQSRHRVITGEDGRFQVDVIAHLIFVENVKASGYRHLYSEWDDQGNMAYQITAWGQQLYKSDPDRPAVFVFVRDGVKEVSALPSRGGYNAEGTNWIPNEPQWPRKPSLKDVVYVPPATRPSTQPGAD